MSKKNAKKFSKTKNMLGHKADSYNGHELKQHSVTSGRVPVGKRAAIGRRKK